MVERAVNYGYICSSCAEELGGVWPEGHRATFHSAKCPRCKKDTVLASWDDWNYPDDKAQNTVANITREI